MNFYHKAISLAGFVLLTVLPAQAQVRQTREEYINKYKKIAVAHMERYGIPASITMAQGILESDCGNSWLSQASNNHFGIKCKRNWTGDVVYYDDDEKGECFRSYPSVEASYQDHAEFLDSQPRYDSLFAYSSDDYKSWARGLKAAGYATAPDYAQRLIRIIEENQLFLLDRPDGERLYASRMGRKVTDPEGWFADQSSVEPAAGASPAIDPDNYRVTINAHNGYNVYATNGYFFGDWPPGHKKFAETFTVLENMAYCHIRCYRMLHETREAMGYSDTMVGFANHLRVFEPENPRNPVQAATAKAVEWLFQGAITEAMTTGTFRWPLRNHWKLPKGEYCDFHGVNYYTRSTVTGFADGVRKNSPRNDLGWEIYPEGIVRCAQKLEKLLRRPIWVTENGTCDNQDAFRARYLYEHLEAIVQSGLPFERYYHWCFCDNFEWLEGESARFGLVNVDYATQTRTIKRSGAFYADMIQHGGVTDEAFNTYVRGEVYRIE